MGQQEIGSPQLIIDGRTIKAALFDLDGTLLTSQGHADPRTVDSIKRLRAAGVLTGLCTGRGVANIEAHLEPWGLIGCLDAYAASGGVDIVDATLTKHERRALLAGTVIDTIIEHFADVPATPAVTIDGVCMRWKRARPFAGSQNASTCRMSWYHGNAYRAKASQNSPSCSTPRIWMKSALQQQRFPPT